MRILITGGAGYIGSHTVQTLLKTNLFSVEKLFVVDNLSTGFRDAIPNGVEFIKGDTRDVILLTDILKKNRIQAVIHFAAKLIVPESAEKPLEYYDNNVNGVICLATACREANVKKIIFSSTAAVYGEPTTLTAVSETNTPHPINPYGASKLMAEGIIRDCEKAFGLRSVCLRYFNVAGASLDGNNGQRSKNVTHLVNVACQAVLGTRALVEIFGTDFPTQDGTGVRDYIHVDDLAELHVRALCYLIEGGRSEIINCGYGIGFSVRQVLESMRRVSTVDFKIQEAGRRVGDPSSLVAKNEKVKTLFKWQPAHADLDLICRSALNWEKQKLNLK